MNNLLKILKQIETPEIDEKNKIISQIIKEVEGDDESLSKASQDETSDIIEASVLHYIKGLVQDSSLKVDLAPYMSELTALAFKYFFSPSWPIR